MCPCPGRQHGVELPPLPGKSIFNPRGNASATVEKRKAAFNLLLAKIRQLLAVQPNVLPPVALGIVTTFLRLEPRRNSKPLAPYQTDVTAVITPPTPDPTPASLPSPVTAAAPEVAARVSISSSAGPREVNDLHLALYTYAEQPIAEETTTTTILGLISREAASALDANGNLALHIALRGGSSATVVKSLLQAAPESAVATDSDGNIPLHIALQSGASPDVVGLVLEAYPKAAMQISTVGAVKRQQAQGYNTLKEACLPCMCMYVYACRC